MLAVVLFGWNNRRMVAPPPAGATAGWLRRGFGAAARLAIRHPETQASFFFTLQALLRSPQHRLTIAVSLAVGLTASVFAVAVGSAARRDAAEAMTAGVLAVQPVLVAALLTGFRHAVRVPAELAANWAVQVAWAGDTRRHIAGAKAAGALLFVALPVLVLSTALRPAVHAARRRRDRAVRGGPAASSCSRPSSSAIARCRSPAATCRPNLKTLAPIAFVSFVFFTYQFAHRERAALAAGSALEFAVDLAVLFLVLRAIDAVKRRTVRPFEFDEMPEPPTQRLGLS